jgi:hypothetical protein
MVGPVAEGLPLAKRGVSVSGPLENPHPKRQRVQRPTRDKMRPIMSEDKTARLVPRDPDPIRASDILVGIPARANAMFATFQAINQRERKAPPWRELQILNFIRYVKMYADDIARSYEAQRIDSVAQAMRNLLEMCIWTEFCEISEANAKRFSDDAARDMRDMLEGRFRLCTPALTKRPKPGLLA